MLREEYNFRNCFIMVWSWSFTSFSYYCISFYLKYFKGSIYVNSFLFGIAGFLGVTTFGVMIQYLSNKSLFTITFFVTFLGSLGFTLTKTNESLVPVWILLMVFSVSIQFSLWYYTNIVLFPPLYRTRIFSVWNIIARTFTMMSPMVVELVDNPMLILWVAAITLMFMSTQLKQN